MELLQLLRVLFSLSLASVAFSTCPANHLCDNFGHCNSIDPVYEAYTCDCVDGVTGQLCETNIKECDSNPCPPNWECTDAYNAYSCACQAGFTGPTCSISMVDNPCYPNPCNDQTCTNTTSGYSCQCDDPTLTGPNCETIIVCTASTCKNGGTCLPQWDGANYLCQCPTGYQDRNCETETASSSTPEFIGCWNIDGSSSNANLERYNLGNDLGVTNCQEKAIADGMTNFGMIADIPGKKYCYTGSLGELTKNTNNSASECWSTCPDDGVKPCGKFDFSLNSTYYAVIYSFTYTPPDALDCPSSVCVNGGLCIEEVGGSSCLCPPDYTSADCSVPFDYCDSDPCHDGTCTPKVGGYTCTCPSKVTGDNCEISQACITAPGNTACQNGGTCVPSGSTYTCECFGIWNLVANCSLFNHCYQKPCVNGKCNDTGDNGIGYTCTCDAGWTGVNCDKDIDECDSNPCVYSNTLNCSNLVDLWVCNCDLGFSGLQCETGKNFQDI
uniref:EGF-like domain-containing protein n=1 Tax=Plectus sambesii TaxID=2011161 RepID=A0A914XAU0_9BILA